MSCPSTFPQEVDEVELQNGCRYVEEMVDKLLKGSNEIDDSSRIQLLRKAILSPEAKKIRKLLGKK